MIMQSIPRRIPPTLLATMALLCAVAGPALAGDQFVVPGVDFSNLSMREGAWCRYLVADEALGQIDTAEVYIGLPAREMTPEGPAFWVEIDSRPLGASSGEAEVLKLLVMERIRDFDEGDFLGEYVMRLYIRNGTHPVQEEDPRNYEGFSQVIPTTDSSWQSVADVSHGTPAGSFTCTRKSRTVNDDKTIQTGNVKLIKKATDDYTVWFSDEVPIFHMVKCVIERSRETKTVPRIAGIPASGSKYSKTTAELVDYGYDAQPILSLQTLPRSAE